MATAFVRSHPAVTSVLIGPRRAEQLQDLLAGADVRLSEDILDRIDEIVPPGTNLNPDDIYSLSWSSPTNASAAASTNAAHGPGSGYQRDGSVGPSRQPIHQCIPKRHPGWLIQSTHVRRRRALAAEER